MSVVCQCPSCKAKYQVGDQYAGRTIKCPKCTAAVVVPGGGPSPGQSGKDLPVARAARLVEDPRSGPASSSSPAAKVPPAVVVPPPVGAAAGDDDLGFLNEGPVTHKRHVTTQSADPSSSGKLASSKIGHSRHSKKKPKVPAWVIPTIAAVSLLALAVIGTAIYYKPWQKALATNAGSDTSAGSSTADGKKAGKGAPKPKVPMLTMHWPANLREGASLFVNDVKQEVPATGAVEIEIPKSKEQYHFRLERRGYQNKEFSRISVEDDQDYEVTEWVPKVGGIDWEQDFEAAKQAAATHSKNVFILFDASDAKESNFASGRFAEAIARRKEFRERADNEYVCIYIDNPQGAEALGRVNNADRNRELTKKFRIKVFPTVVVTDSRGRAFGILEGYRVNGVNAFLELLDKWAADGKSLFGLLDRVDAMPKGAQNSNLVANVIDFLEMNKLVRFYPDTVKDLHARLPKGENPPVTKELADMWMGRFYLAVKSPDNFKKEVEEFDQWKKSRTFKDRDMGAAMHFALAWLMVRLDLRTEAAQKCKEGLALQPRNLRLKELLQHFSRALSGGPGDFAVGSGTGFCIAPGNYVLTNHHVIEGAKKIKVRVNGEKEKYPAKLVADDETGDMALLKIELPEDKKLDPIPLAGAGVTIGEDVCALGFPGGVMEQNINLTFTKGVISNLPAADDEEGYIATDCKINPGNSGGPLCGSSGGIAGMVTAKSSITAMQDSYGLVIPVDRLRKFLMENLPPDARKLLPRPSREANLKPSDVAKKVVASVVCVENFQ